MPTVVTEPLLARPPLRFPPVTFPVVKSVWATTPPITTDPYSPANWTDAAVMEIPEGFLLVKNDQKFLYLLIDLVKDHSKIMGNNDYFWLTFDVDKNAAITPNRDLNYTLFPVGAAHAWTFGKQFYRAPDTWTGYNKTTSHMRMTFGVSPKSTAAHRMWEVQIDLNEVRFPRFFPPYRPPFLRLPDLLRFGLRVASSSPSFTDDFPKNFEATFAHLPGVLLARSVALPVTGAPVVGVGYIPLGCLDTTGRGNTAADYRIHLTNTAFGGVLEIVGDRKLLQTMWNQGKVKKYRISDNNQVMFQVWGVYHLVNGQWHYEHVTPDDEGCYQFIDFSETYSIDALLFQWNTTGVTSGTHEVKFEFLDDTDTVVTGYTQKFNLMIDNNLPNVDIVDIQYKDTSNTWKSVQPCDILNIKPGPDMLQISYVANDAAGDLKDYGLTAWYGHDQAVDIIPDTTPANGHGVGDDKNPATVTAGPNFPPQTCAYEFRLWAYANVTDGCDWIGYVDDSWHVTINKL